MPKRIEDLLHRRNDLSTFLVHLTKAGLHPARDNLLRILLAQTLEARTPMGLGSSYFNVDAAFRDSQKVVCFTETPLEHVWMMCEEIEHRDVQIQPYGVVFTKSWARRQGVNPVMYVDITIGHDWLTEPANLMLRAAHEGHAVTLVDGDWSRIDLAHSPIAKLTPFFEPMGKPRDIRREWWWEREWRHAGDLLFQWTDLVAVFVPEDDREAFEADFNEGRAAQFYAPPIRRFNYLDPRWGQERMIATLAGVPIDDVGPFP